MVYIAYYTKLNVQNGNNAQKRRICRENSKYAPDKKFCGHFCPHPKAANFCHPGMFYIKRLQHKQMRWNFISNSNKYTYVHMNGYQPTKYRTLHHFIPDLRRASLETILIFVFHSNFIRFNSDDWLWCWIWLLCKKNQIGHLLQDSGCRAVDFEWLVQKRADIKFLANIFNLRHTSRVPVTWITRYSCLKKKFFFLIFRGSGSTLASEYSFAPEAGQTTGLPESTCVMWIHSNIKQQNEGNGL